MNPEVMHLQNPDELALKNAYRTLQQMGEISLHILVKNLADTLRIMESVGYIGMEIAYFNPSSGSINIRAYKGKNGPCLNTGRDAIYQGAALAVLDDDNHLLFASKKVQICEKTAKIYKLPVYEKLVKCSDANSDLIPKLDGDPEIFSCDSFEDDQEKLFQYINDTQKTNELVDLFYPGPFRLLILNDGRVIKRGQITRLPKSDAGQLIKKDSLFKLENFKTGQPVFFQDLYTSYGARCLLDNYVGYDLPERDGKTDFSILDKASRELKEQLLRLIKKNKKYFILTGSDLGDRLGCCPSEIVTAANKLKSAGILDSYIQPAPDETCPLTIYAFKNEIKIIDNTLQFNLNNDLRQLVLEKLQFKTNYQLRLFARWILLAFIVITLTIAFLKLQDSSSAPTNLSLYEQLVPGNQNQQLVLLFHYSERCNQCLNMEKFTNEVLNEDFSELVANRMLQFKLIKMDLPENRNLVERFELFTTTIVLVQFENKQEKKIKVLKDLWEYSDDGDLFKNMLKKELNQFLSNKHE